MKTIRILLNILLLLSFMPACSDENGTTVDGGLDSKGGSGITDVVTRPQYPVDSAWWGWEGIGSTLADSAFCYYNQAFLLDRINSEDGNIYYCHQQEHIKQSYFWNYALVILMVEDRYQCLKDESLKPLISELLYAFMDTNNDKKVAEGTFEWAYNIYTDDLLWAGLAFIRGYQITGDKTFLDIAERDWKHLYNQAYDEVYGGGLWWSTGKESKSGLSNNPAVSMACYLYEATGNEEYLQRAKELFQWLYMTLRQPTGGVDENISGPEPGKLTDSYNVYNIGAFIEACNALYRITKEDIYKETAMQSIKYVMTEGVNDEGIMSAHRYEGSWESEFARGMGLFVHETGLWNYETVYTKERKPITYYEWMRLNARLSWERRNDENLTWNEWAKRTPNVPEDAPSGRKVWTALECVSMVVMNQVTPEANPLEE